jgi:hypothetical protein
MGYLDQAFMVRDAQAIAITASRFACEETGSPLIVCECGRDHINDAALRTRRDPTRTLDLRRSFIRELERRWRRLSALVTEALVTQDMFGLTAANAYKLQIISMSSGRVNAFQSWIDTALADTILGLNREVWIGHFIDQAYTRGWKAAQSQVGRVLPANMDRADILTKLTISELQGVIEAFSQRAVRAFSDGLLSHRPPATIARAIRQEVGKIGVVRSRATAQTMIVRANGEAALDYFQTADIKMVGVLPETIPSPGRPHAIRDARRKRKRRDLVEVRRAGDDNVCPICQDIADNNPYTIAEARGLIPAHPNCRCAFVPLDDKRFAHGDALRDEWSEEDHPRDPNGEFANGSGEKKDVTGSPAFKKWFGESKVVDKSGRPLIVYHGTASGQLEELHPNAPLIKATGNKDMEGIYFTGDPNAAHNYAAMAARQGRGASRAVLGVYLKIEHPLDTTKAIKAFQKKGMTFGEAKREALKSFDPKKHDGVIFGGDSYNPPEYIVLKSNQVKSATKNSGTFNPNSSRIVDGEV